MSIRKKIIELPEGLHLQTIMERSVFIEKVEKGLEQLVSGNTIPHEEVKQRIKEWSKNISGN